MKLWLRRAWSWSWVLTLPIAVRGTLAEPAVGVDLRKVLEDGLGRKLKDAFKDLFGR